jgi:phosphate transport system substrate-binding protein
LKEGKVDFCASEVPLSDEIVAESHQRFIQLPTILGAVVPIYNLKAVRQSLRFTRSPGRHLPGKDKKMERPAVHSLKPKRRPSGRRHHCGSSLRRQRHQLCLD